MNNFEKEPQSGQIPEEDRDKIQKTSEVDKGQTYENYRDFYDAYFAAGTHPTVRIHNQRIADGILVDDPSGFVDAFPHKITEHSANMNVYNDNELVAYFRLDKQNISQFSIEILEK